jgi:SAM-dependent methyltransferase
MTSGKNQISDTATADAFATSWNNLPEGSIYTRDQFEDWMTPVTRNDVAAKRVIELGCGNASLLVHMAEWGPAYLEGIDLGDSVLSAEKNMAKVASWNWKISKGDLVGFKSDGFDFVYCIGVLHHLKAPDKGFDSVIRNTRRGGRFHCWVYAREGNTLIVLIVDPMRKIVSHLPWWFTKYFVATPLAVPFYLYAKLVSVLPRNSFAKKMPLSEYMLWISKREFAFFRHVAFDQLVTPQTTYLSKQTLENWLAGHAEIDPASTYIIMRNGNSWKFGGRKR